MRNIDDFKISDVLATQSPAVVSDDKLDDLFVPVELNEKESEHLAAEPYSYWKSVFKVFMKKPSAKIALVSLVLFILAVIIIPLFAPENINVSADGVNHLNEAPSWKYLFGTDSAGRDLFFLCFVGARKSLLLALVSSAINIVIGTLIGLVWGFFRRLDPIFIEIYNLVSNIPSLLLYMLLAQIFAQALPTVPVEVRLIISLTLLGWLGIARFIRNQTIIITNREYNVASKTLGSSPMRIMMKNLLPYILAVIITELSLLIPGMISSEVSLSYFGVGLPSQDIALGVLVKAGVSFVSTYPWQLLFPGLILAWIIFTFYLFGLALSDALDPKKHR